MTVWPEAISAASRRRSRSKLSRVRWNSQPSVSTTRRCDGQWKSASTGVWPSAARGWLTSGFGRPVSRELQEAGFEVAARPPRLVRRRRGEAPASSMPVGPGDDVGDGVVVVDPQALGLGQRALEALGARAGREVEEPQRELRDRDALVARRIHGPVGP